MKDRRLVKLERVVCPILSLYKDTTTLQHSGSGLLIRLRSNELIVLTAAHVIDSDNQSLKSCFIAIKDGDTYKIIKLMRLTYPDIENDLVVARVMNCKMENNCKPLMFNDLFTGNSSDTIDGSLFAYGYPNEKLVLFSDNKTYTYEAPLIQFDPQILKDLHSKNRSLVRYDYLTTKIRPGGMSGSPLWKDDAEGKIYFLGILLRWDEKEKYIQFVEIGVFREYLKNTHTAVSAFNQLDPHPSKEEIENAQRQAITYESAFGAVEA